MVRLTRRGLLIASGIWLVAMCLFALALQGPWAHPTAAVGLLRGLAFLALGLSCSALAAAWVAWAMHYRGRTGGGSD